MEIFSCKVEGKNSVYYPCLWHSIDAVFPEWLLLRCRYYFNSFFSSVSCKNDKRCDPKKRKLKNTISDNVVNINNIIDLKGTR